MKSWIAAALLVIGCGRGQLPPVPAKEALPANSPLPARSELGAFYSGHSLMQGVLPAVEAIAGSLGGAFEHEEQIGVGSLIAARVDAPLLEAPARYDALVVTERHDIPYSSFHDESPRHLRTLMDKLHAQNPEARTLLYHTWLESDHATPAEWIAYEQIALRHWECIASSVNHELKKEGKPQRVHVLPGATAMGALVASMLRGEGGPAVTKLPREQRMELVFFDGVHMTPAGAYFMGAVHYAALFGSSPVGAAVPKEIDAQLARHMQELAWREVSAYQQHAEAASQRDLAECRTYAAQRMCPAFYELRGRKPMGLVARLRHWKNEWQCARGYEDASAPKNPFR